MVYTGDFPRNGSAEDKARIINNVKVSSEARPIVHCHMLTT
jgi:hypothetical protein